MPHSADKLTIAELFAGLPERFRPEKAADETAIFHFVIRDGKKKQGGDYTVAIGRGRCGVESGLHGKAGCVVQAKADTYIDIETGKANPQMALMTGKVKVSNLAAMLKFAAWFRTYSPNSGQGGPAHPFLSPDVSGKRPKLEGPLAGTRVLDLTRLLPGPLASMHLADMGAEVIKVEDPNSPDLTRSFPPFLGSQSVHYLAVNRSKKSLTLNLRSEKGKQILAQLVKTADVLLESFRPGIMEKIGFGYAAAAKLKPDLVYVSISGYGQTGPYAPKAGHDINYIGYAGILGLNGLPGTKAVVPGVQIADIAGGSYTAINAVLLGLLQRQRTGEGGYYDISMADAALPLMALPLTAYWGGETGQGRGSTMLSGGLPNYDTYVCKDGKCVALGTLEPKFWEAFCNAVGRPEWRNRILPGTTEGNLKLADDLGELFASKTRDEWVALASGFDFCLSPVLELHEIEQDPQLLHRNMIRKNRTAEGHGYKTIGQPIKTGGMQRQGGWEPPALGEDTAAILHEMGYGEADVEGLRQNGIV